MEHSVSNAARVAASPERVEHLATGCLHVDDAIVRSRAIAESLNATWVTLRHDLADMVVELARNGYVATPVVIEALGGKDFSDGPLYDAAIRLGYLTALDRGDPWSYKETPEGDGILDAITRMLGNLP